MASEPGKIKETSADRSARPRCAVETWQGVRRNQYTASEHRSRGAGMPLPVVTYRRLEVFISVPGQRRELKEDLRPETPLPIPQD